MNHRFLTLSSALALLALGGCGERASERPPLAGAAIGGPFALVDQDGKPVTDQSFAGRYRAIYFGYTFCPDVCPTTLQALMAGYRKFAAEVGDAGVDPRLTPIFISVDPARDTPAVLKSYVAAFGPGLVGLTGTPAEIARVAKAYGTYFKTQPAAKGASGYLVDHSSQVLLFDPDGKPLAILPTDQGPDAIAAELKKWVR